MTYLTFCNIFFRFVSFSLASFCIVHFAPFFVCVCVCVLWRYEHVNWFSWGRNVGGRTVWWMSEWECTRFTLFVHYGPFVGVFSLQMPTIVLRIEWRCLTLILLSYILVGSFCCYCCSCCCFLWLFVVFLHLCALVRTKLLLFILPLYYSFHSYNSIFHCDFSNINFITFIQIIARYILAHTHWERDTHEWKWKTKIPDWNPCNKNPTNTAQVHSNLFGARAKIMEHLSFILRIHTHMWVSDWELFCFRFHFQFNSYDMRMGQREGGNSLCLHDGETGKHKWYAVLQKFQVYLRFIFYSLFRIACHMWKIGFILPHT